MRERGNIWRCEKKYWFILFNCYLQKVNHVLVILHYIRFHCLVAEQHAYLSQSAKRSGAFCFEPDVHGILKCNNTQMLYFILGCISMMTHTHIYIYDICVINIYQMISWTSSSWTNNHMKRKPITLWAQKLFCCPMWTQTWLLITYNLFVIEKSLNHDTHCHKWVMWAIYVTMRFEVSGLAPIT